MLALERPEDLAGPVNHGLGQTGQLGHVDAVGPVGPARLQPVEEIDSKSDDVAAEEVQAYVEQAEVAKSLSRKDAKSLEACVAQVVKQFGGINILVNDAQEVPLGTLEQVTDAALSPRKNQLVLARDQFKKRNPPIR